MDKAGIGEKICIEGIFLVCGRTLGEQVDDVRDLAFWMVSSVKIISIE
jgi:hypothetical protein